MTLIPIRMPPAGIRIWGGATVLSPADITKVTYLGLNGRSLKH